VKKTQLLQIIGELGFVDIRKNGSIHITPPAINVHHVRMEPFVRFLQDYVSVHHNSCFSGYFTLYDAWREHAEPCDDPEFVVLTKQSLNKYIGRGTIGESGRFIQPYALKNLFPVFDHPVVAFGRHSNDPFVELIPDTDFIRSGGYEELKAAIDAQDCEWQHKHTRFFWRGSMHGFPYKSYDPAGIRSQRELLVEWSSQHADICDASPSHTSSKQEQLLYKFIIDIDGEVNAWSGLFWKLYSNSVVFKVESHYEQWYYHKLKAWIHYIPVRGNLSDLKEKYDWALQHDDECRQIAMAGRNFAASLTYQSEIENIKLSDNTKVLMQAYSVARKSLTSRRSLKNPAVVIHTYQSRCNSVVQPPGFGDFLRGSVALFQLSRKYRFELRLDFTTHPLGAFLRQYDHIPNIGNEKVHEFFNAKNCELEPCLATLSDAQVFFVMTHAVPTEPIDDECRNFILERLRPLSGLDAFLETVLSNLGLDRFCTVHLRLGDHTMAKDAQLPENIFRCLKEVVLPSWGDQVFLVSDNAAIKAVLKNDLGVKSIGINPVHLGQCLSGKNAMQDVHGTITEFLLMAQSQRIYQYSVYPWGSGFSDICSQLFKIPLEKLREVVWIENSVQNSAAKGDEHMQLSPKNNKRLDAQKVLNVGGNNKAIALPTIFDGWHHDLLDIDPLGNPDVLCDARELWKLPPRQYDAIYCSHNLEHYYKHDVLKVLKGFRMVLKKNGFALIKVPDMHEVMRRVISENLDIDDVLYHTSHAPIHVSDVIYGWQKQIANSGNDYFAHKTGFTRRSLERILKENGFPYVFSVEENLEIASLAFMQQPDEMLLAQLGLNQ